MIAALTIAGGVLALVAGLVWVLVIVEKRSAQLEVGEKFARKEAENAKAAGTVMAEHRDPDDTASRLRDGSF